MKKIKKLLSLVIISTLVLSIFEFNTSLTVFAIGGGDEDFNNRTNISDLTNWVFTGWSGNNIASIVDKPDGKGGFVANEKCLRMTKETSNCYADGLATYTPLTGRVIFENTFMIDGLNGPLFGSMPKIMDTNGAPIVQMMVYNTALYCHNGNAGGSNVASLVLSA